MSGRGGGQLLQARWLRGRQGMGRTSTRKGDKYNEFDGDVSDDGGELDDGGEGARAAGAGRSSWAPNLGV
eukprot:9488083-Pyramimonas_sp.AAC.1